MSRMRIEFDHQMDDLDLLPDAGFERVYKGQRRFDDNVNQGRNAKKRQGKRIVRTDKTNFDKDM